jgi:SnoaL-like domain
MSPTLTCDACGARWHTAARRGSIKSSESCLRCGGALSEQDRLVSVIEALVAHAYARNFDAALALCHAEIEIYEIPELFPGEDESFTGHEGARRWIERTFAIWDLEFRVSRRETRVADDRTVELKSDVQARSSHGHPDFSATTSSRWKFEDGLLRCVEFSGVGAAAADANPA